jgi:hypothetical protein
MLEHEDLWNRNRSRGKTSAETRARCPPLVISDVERCEALDRARMAVRNGAISLFLPNQGLASFVGGEGRLGKNRSQIPLIRRTTDIVSNKMRRSSQKDRCCT